jgi:hypothetical protein
MRLRAFGVIFWERHRSWDLHTLHVEHAALLTLLMILTVINIRIHRTAAGVVWFAGFGSCILRGRSTDRFAHLRSGRNFPSLWANVMFLRRLFCACIVSMTGFFAKGAGQWRIQAGLVALQIISQTEYGWLHPDTTKRLLALSIILAMQVGLTSIFVFRHTAAFMKAAGWLMGTLLALLSLGNLGRLFQPADCPCAKQLPARRGGAGMDDSQHNHPAGWCSGGFCMDDGGPASSRPGGAGTHRSSDRCSESPRHRTPGKAHIRCKCERVSAHFSDPLRSGRLQADQ